jgi:hypothetical protein
VIASLQTMLKFDRPSLRAVLAAFALAANGMAHTLTAAADDLAGLSPADASSSVPVSSQAARKKSTSLAKLPVSKKPVEPEQLGSSVPVIEPIWLDRPTPGSRSHVPNVFYSEASTGRWGGGAIVDSMKANNGARLTGTGGYESGAVRFCTYRERTTHACVELKGNFGALNRDADHKSVFIVNGGMNLQFDKFLFSAEGERDIRYGRAGQLNIGTVLASNKLDASLQLKGGYGSLKPLESAKTGQGGQIKVELEKYLGEFNKVTLAAEAGKYARAERLRVTAGMSIKLGSYNGWQFFARPEAIYTASEHKLVGGNQNPDGNSEVRLQAVTGMLNVGFERTAGAGGNAGTAL